MKRPICQLGARAAVRGKGLGGVAAHPGLASAWPPRPVSPSYRARCLKRTRRGVVKGRGGCPTRVQNVTRDPNARPAFQ